MANLLDTYLLPLQAKYSGDFDRYEHRDSRYGILDLYLKQTSGIDSLINEEVRNFAANSEGRAINIPVMKKGGLTVKTSRSCTIDSFENVSAVVNMTMSTIVFDISMVKAQYAKNAISYEKDFGMKMKLVKEGILKAIEQAAFTNLDANKSAVYGSTLVGTGNKYGALVGDSVQVTTADHETFFNDVEALQAADDIYSSTHNVVGSTNLMPFVNHFANQGGANNTNLSYQFGDKSFAFSNSVVDGASKKATGYVVPEGSVGLVTRINADARLGHSATDGTQWFSSNLAGMLPFEVGVMYKSSCSDQSALNGSGMEHLEASMLEQWQFSVDFGLVNSYHSDVAEATQIKKFEFIS